MLSAAPALADAIDFAISRLKTSEDFRVRTQSAMLLGASQDSRAVTPLCDCLDDENETVAGACAVGLGKLQLGGLPCLEAQLAVEDSEWVRMLIERAIERLKDAQNPAPALRQGPVMQRLPDFH